MTGFARHRRGLTRWEVLTGLMCFAGLVWWYAPRVQVLIYRSRRAEVGYVLEELQIWAQTHGAHAAGPFPQPPDAVGGHRVELVGGPSGWDPPTKLARGSYQIAGGKLIGVCDVDGDGVPARYVATPGGPIVRETAPDVY